MKAAIAAPASALPAMVQPQLQPSTQMVPMALQQQYFANWDPFGAPTVMFNPMSPFCPGSCHGHKKSHHCHHKKKKKKKKKKKEVIYVQPPGKSLCTTLWCIAAVSKSCSNEPSKK